MSSSCRSEWILASLKILSMNNGSWRLLWSPIVSANFLTWGERTFGRCSSTTTQRSPWWCSAGRPTPTGSGPSSWSSTTAPTICWSWPRCSDTRDTRKHAMPFSSSLPSLGWSPGLCFPWYCCDNHHIETSGLLGAECTQHGSSTQPWLMRRTSSRCFPPIISSTDSSAPSSSSTSCGPTSSSKRYKKRYPREGLTINEAIVSPQRRKTRMIMNWRKTYEKPNLCQKCNITAKTVEVSIYIFVAGAVAIFTFTIPDVRYHKYNVFVLPPKYNWMVKEVGRLEFCEIRFCRMHYWEYWWGCIAGYHLCCSKPRQKN